MKDGWRALAPGYPGSTVGKDLEMMKAAPWELYNIEEDFSQANDLAAKNPEKLKALQAKLLEEGTKYNVFPLDPRFAERFDPKLRGGAEQATSWTYRGNNVWLPEPIGPQLFPRGHTITATLDIPKGGAEGVVTCVGAFSAGWTLYIKDGKPSYRYQLFEIADVEIPGTVAIPDGEGGVEDRVHPGLGIEGPVAVR